MTELADSPHLRGAQRALAAEVTRLVHGEQALDSAERITEALFGGELATLTEQDLEQLKLDGMDATEVAAG